MFTSIIYLLLSGTLNSGSPYLLIAMLTFFAFLHSFEFYTFPEEEIAVPMYEFKSIDYAIESNESMSLLKGEDYDEDGSIDMDSDEDVAHI